LSFLDFLLKLSLDLLPLFADIAACESANRLGDGFT
jgi:hypothetical protein